MNLLYVICETCQAFKCTCAHKTNPFWVIISRLCCICRRLISPQLAHQHADCTEQKQQVNAVAGARTQSHSTFPSTHPWLETNVSIWGSFQPGEILRNFLVSFRGTFWMMNIKMLKRGIFNLSVRKQLPSQKVFKVFVGATCSCP